MSSRTIKKSVLFRTSSNTDVKRSGGHVTIAGLETIRVAAISSITQINYRAEVAQVVTVGATDYTPSGGTPYTIAIFDPLRTISGSTETRKTYSYTTPSDITQLGATTALQKEAISAALVLKINADTANCHASAVSLGSGNGITITDSGSYYPVPSQNMANTRGANEVYLIPNADGSGFAKTNITVTTAAVYSFGVGANLAAEKPVVDFVMGGSVVSGIIDTPPVTADGLPAVSGQKYVGFTLEDMKIVDAITLGGQFAYQSRIQRVFVDNGAGTATTNLAGYLTFTKEMHKLMASVYNDNCTTVEFFDKNFLIQGPLGAAPATTTSLVNKFITPYGLLQHTNIGTQTIVAPTQGTLGLLTDQDVNTGDGAEYYPATATPNSQQFVVGKQECIGIWAFSVTAVTGANCLFGFRKKETFQLDYNDYNDLAAIGFTSASGKFSTAGILANAATVTTTSASVGAANGVKSFYVVKVDINGLVTCYADGVAYPVYSAGTTPMSFAAGTVLIPFFLTTQITGTASVGVVDEFLAVSNKDLIVY